MSCRGRIIPLSLPRRLVGDLVHFARKVPSIPVQRRMNLAAVVRARRQLEDRPGWGALFVKAFAVAAVRHPELRRAYLHFPWPRLYEHPISIASVAVERRYLNEDAVFLAHISAADEKGLTEIDGYFKRFKQDPIESIGIYRRALRVSRLPGPLRRMMWWIGLNQSGSARARRMGTFGFSVYSSLGAESLHPLSPLTCTLNYGVIGADGHVDVRLIYDHRVMDGSTVARALQTIEQVLNCEILAELAEMARGSRSVAA